jgi:predicted ArsR family transcriptional regulator
VQDYHPAVEPARVDSYDHLYETARALGEETRFRVYRAICTSEGPVPVTALAQTFALHPNAIRPHLAHLEEAGLVVSRTDREGAGAGRPRRLYEPSPEPMEFAHPPRPLGALVRMLAEAVESLPSKPRDLVSFGHAWGRAWVVKDSRKRSVPRSRRGRADLLARELAGWGWRPTVTRAAGEIRLTTGACLFGELSPSVNGRSCALEEGLLTGLVEALVNGHAAVARTGGCHHEIVL